MSGEKEEKKNRSTKPKFLWEKLLFGVFAVIFLGERLTATGIVGGLVIVTGVVLANTELFRRLK